MNDMTAKMKTLIEELNAASKAYYGGSGELIPDAVWNAKLDELEALEKESGIILPDSPTHNVSHEIIVGEKENHEFPALSLPKSKLVEDVIKWAIDKELDLSWKLDGMTLVVTYDNGELTKVVTRGDGEVGSNITHLVDAISNIPKKITYDKHLVIRGEAVISYADFERINEEYNGAYENPRNLVAGSLNPLTQVDNIMGRCINWVPFTLVYIENDINSWKDRINFLKKIGFEVVESEFLASSALLSDTIDKWSSKVESVVYPVDGLVIVYDDTEYASGGSLTGHHDTRGGYAFKWADEEAETELTEIEWSVSIHSINPVAIFKPVRLEGTTVQRASLCNVSECERLGIGNVGSKLTVIKANKIIPKVIKADGVGDFIIPSHCPVCKAQTRLSISKDTNTKILTCTNDNCAAKNIGKMSRFVSKHGFNINGLSDKRLMELVNKNLISNASDIFDLVSHPEDVYAVLSDVEGWGDKSIKNLIDAIEAAKSVKPENLLYALCIPMCGRDVSKKLVQRYGSVETIFDLAVSDSRNDTNIIMSGIDGVGDAKSSSFIDWFKLEDNVKFMSKLIDTCNVNKAGTVNTSSPMAGLTFVVTGSLNKYASRDELKEFIESNGGKVSGSVSAKTSYLINNDVESTSGKNKKAKELSVKIISEDDFIREFVKE